jgi:hypothetical protein
MARVGSHLPFELDARDPDFFREIQLWSSQTQGDLQELLAATQQTIATTKALIAEVDRMIALK